MKHLLRALTLTPFILSHAYANTDMSEFPHWQYVLENEHVKVPIVQIAPFKQELQSLHSYYLKHYSYSHTFDNFWQTREQFKERATGDCKDFAVAEMYDLIEKSVPQNEMYIYVVMVKKTHEVHAILQAGDYVLDILSPKIYSKKLINQKYKVYYRINRHEWFNGE